MPENKRFQAQQIGDAARVIDTEIFFLVEGRPKTVEWFDSFEEAQAKADKLNRIYGHASDEPKCEGYYYYRCGRCNYIVKSVLGTEGRKRIVCKYCKSRLTPIATIEEQSATLPLHPLIRDRHIPKHIRNEMLKRDNYTCRNCGSTTDLQVDHIIPFHLGGSNEANNLQVLCSYCNQSKGIRLHFRVKEVARAKGFGLRKLSRASDVEYKTLKAIYDFPFRYIPATMLNKIAGALGVPPSELIEDIMAEDKGDIA